MSEPVPDIEKMTKQERWELIQRLWNSLGDDAVELSPTQSAELDRRSADLDRDLAADRPLGAAWSDVLGRLRADRGERS